MKTIGISTSLISQGHRRMFDALGKLFGICFEARNFGSESGVDAWVFPEINPETILPIRNSQIPSYAVISEKYLISCDESKVIKFNQHPSIPDILQNIEISSDEAITLKGLPETMSGMSTIAAKAGSTIWAVQDISRHFQHYVTLSIPELEKDEPIFHYFNGNQFIALLPLLTFLQQLTDDSRWIPPPLQACFMFDDPNLHWPTYGFINFLEMARHADQHNYHSSFATIPFDAWYVHKQTANLFHKYRNRISLLMHGNDHITDELGRKTNIEERSRTLRQALSRIEKFEKCANVAVARVMAPPHGACSEETLNEMALLGYEGACISRGSLEHHNRNANWTRTMGMSPSDIICGLPVIPRFRISSDCQNAILVAALLHQPIIPVGHHRDVADNMDLLADLSSFINSLGHVRWTNMTDISRANYAKFIDGDILHLKMYSKLIDVLIPDGINHIVVERPWLEEETKESLFIKTSSNQKNVQVDVKQSIAVSPGQQIQVISSQNSQLQCNYDAINKFKFWPIMRRLITESRDRLAPKLRHIATRFTSNQ
jgi:hypothetical protein